MKPWSLRFAFILMLCWQSISAQEVTQIPPPDHVAAPPAHAIQHEEGMHYLVLEPGTGELPTRKFVKSSINAWTSADGITRWNAKETGESANELDRVRAMVPGFAEAMAATPIGETRRWWIAADLLKPAWPAFVPGDYTLDLTITGHLDPLPAPDDVAQPPANAQTTATGLSIRFLHRGRGDEKPGLQDTVTNHYTGWTTDGEMFDSSVIRGQPADFPVNGLIAGMTEGLQLMSVGDKARIWIPKNLAYGDNPRPGAPHGDLVFDVELIAIKPAAIDQ